MHRLLRCAGLLALSLAFAVSTLAAQATADPKKDDKKDAKGKKEKFKADWSGELAGKLTVLDENDVARLAFTVQVSLQYPELDTGVQQELNQLQLTYAQQQIQVGQANKAQALQTAINNLQQTRLKMEQAKARLFRLKSKTFDVKCKAADNMRVRYFVPVQPIDPDTGEYLKMTKEVLEDARGPEGYPGYKADYKVLQKGQMVRVFLSKDAMVPAALLDKGQKDNDKLKLDDVQKELKNSYGVIMIVVVADPAKGTNWLIETPWAICMTPILDREEYIEQAYFFNVLRERLSQNMPAQEVLERLHEEILSTTHLPYAIQFLATELKHSGNLSSGFSRLLHYFTPFQAFVIQQTETEGMRFSTDSALLILEREATFRAAAVTKPGLFVYQFETLSRNRLGYDIGLAAMHADPMYDDNWRKYLELVRQQVGVVDFADIIYVRSELYAKDQRRARPDYEPPLPPLFGEKEGRIAKANRGRDPLYLFSALQRQLSYPEVPRPKPRDDMAARLETLKVRVRELEIRLKVMDADLKGQVDVTQFLAKPELLKGPGGDDEL